MNGQYVLLIIMLFASLLTVTCSLIYFQTVHMERPPIGVFNKEDIAILFMFLLVLPFIYVAIPPLLLTVILVVAFIGLIYTGLRPLMRARYALLTAIVLLAANIVVTQTSKTGWAMGMQIHWALNDLIIILGAVTISNLYVQGAMRLRHVAWFALLLALYDAFFAWVVPLTPALLIHLENTAIDPAIAFTIGTFRMSIGLGDLFVFSLFTVAAYKGFSVRGMIASLGLVAIFGTLLPLGVVLVLTAMTGRANVTVPAQVFFGPAAFITYLWLSRHTQERSMRQWYNAHTKPGSTPLGVSTHARQEVKTTP
ncbi:MAG: hypothetical protein JO202_03160 [Ktedonobacteraceae bacterium]|nr:hypothetical protein [Ktedonobacteraceae bacterium]